MPHELTGNLTGLAPSEHAALMRIYRRYVDPALVVTPELAATMCEISHGLHRQIGVLISRRGEIEHVVVGDASKILLPDVGRMRGAIGRFRGLRLVHTHLRGESLTNDDLTDLSLLRLDLVAAILVEGGGRPGSVFIGHLLPDNPNGQLWRQLPAMPVSKLEELNALTTIQTLEAEFAKEMQHGRASAQNVRALLVHVSIGKKPNSAARIAELKELCRTAGVTIADIMEQKRPTVDPKYLVGHGKLEQILLRAMQLSVDMVIFDQNLTPAQARAVSEFTEMKILDRTMLILDIFAQHAKTKDGKLQVELAQLRYALPRLIEKNTMMSRLTGGIGGRGPGETKLEINRRRARERISLLEKRRKEIAKQRARKRDNRSIREVPIVAIVGYTNAGKSTLINTLTQSEVIAENKLFATLDPVSRRLRFPSEREVVLIDTVGFIQDLPPELIEAFRATLEEIAEADILVHVVDISDPFFEDHIVVVDSILAELELAHIPKLIACNKADLLPAEQAHEIAQRLGGFAISANSPASLRPLLAELDQGLWRQDKIPSPELANPEIAFQD